MTMKSRGQAIRLQIFAYLKKCETEFDYYPLTQEVARIVGVSKSCAHRHMLELRGADGLRLKPLLNGPAHTVAALRRRQARVEMPVPVDEFFQNQGAV